MRQIAKQVPLLASIYRSLRSRYAAYRLKRKGTEEIFTDIYTRNSWDGKESISGPGSDISQTQSIIKKLPVLLGKYEIRTLLDIPCGDFNWMKHVDLCNVDYTGADIVGDLIVKNARLYERAGVRFRKLDLINDSLPTVDLILCRDCLVHLSFDDVFRALKNICRSQSSYLLATTFSGRHKNADIRTGEWRPLNLQMSPLELPPPLELINEGCTQSKGEYSDKSLGLWRISDISEMLTLRSSGRTIPHR